MRQEAIAETKQTAKNKDDGAVSDDWTEDQTQLLIKAVNLFPAGTASRYRALTGILKANHNGNEKVAELTILKTFVYCLSRSARTLRVEHRLFQLIPHPATSFTSIPVAIQPMSDFDPAWL